MSPLPFSPSFARHDCAPRKFRVRVYDKTFDEIVVEIVDSWRVRFRCRHCQGIFTEYPPFALRHKRFVKQDVLSKACRYLQNNQATYRTTVQERRVPLSYRPDAGPERGFSHCTVWRWLSWLGSMTEILQKATQLILEKDPKADVHRKKHPIAKTKYRSPRRRATLGQAVQMLKVADIFPRLFGVSLFTHFATALA